MSASAFGQNWKYSRLRDEVSWENLAAVLCALIPFLFLSVAAAAGSGGGACRLSGYRSNQGSAERFEPKLNFLWKAFQGSWICDGGAEKWVVKQVDGGLMWADGQRADTVETILCRTAFLNLWVTISKWVAASLAARDRDFEIIIMLVIHIQFKSVISICLFSTSVPVYCFLTRHGSKQASVSIFVE